METNQDQPQMTAFVCVNCLSTGSLPTQSNGISPALHDFAWPARVRQVLLPCTGRLQPEHVLRAFECGSSVVSVVACGNDNCHYIEGSRRCACRVDYVRSILKEIGLAEERLLLFHLEDPAPAAGSPFLSGSPDLPVRLAEIKEQAMRALRAQGPSPLAPLPPGEAGGGRDE